MIVQTPAQFAVALRSIKANKVIVVDLETTGLKAFHDSKMCGVAVKSGKSSFYFPFRHGSGKNIPMGRLPELMKVLSDPKKLYIGFNYKFDMHFLKRDGAETPAQVEDVLLAAHLMNENEKSLKLKVLSDKYIGAGSSDEQTALYARLAELGYKGKGAAGEMWRLTPEEVGPYAIQDVELTWKLRQFYIPHLKTWKLYDIYKEVCEYLIVTEKMEYRGLLIDVPLVKKYMAEAELKIAPAKAELNEMAGYDININSYQQLRSMLGVSSTAAEVLEYLADRKDDSFQTKGAKAILTYRGWNTVNSRYYADYLRCVDTEDTIHTSLWLTGTVTGRFSCSEPPLHGTPRYSEVYRNKDVFIARPGYDLVVCDYSQAEMRLAIHYTRCPAMGKAFVDGLDIHQMTADECRITRQEGKTINFGIIYGLGAPGLAGQLGIPESQARLLLNAYHKRYPGFRALYRECERMATNRGYIRMWTGRVRRYGLTSPAHKAMPNLIQGGVGEMMRTTITRLDRELSPQGVHMLLQVHDSIIFEVPKTITTEVVPRIVSTMQDHNFRVPMKVDVGIGPAWGKLEKYELK